MDECINYLFNQCRTSKPSREAKVPIPGTYIYTNSLNIYVGNQGSGKTHPMMKDIIKICHVEYCRLVVALVVSLNEPKNLCYIDFFAHFGGSKKYKKYEKI